MQSGDFVRSNVAKIATLFPQCVTERLNKDGKPEPCHRLRQVAVGA